MVKQSTLQYGKITYKYAYDVTAPDNLDVRHCHDQYEILYVVNGTGKYIIEGTEYPIRPRTLTVIPPLEYHCIVLNDAVPYERYILRFSSSDIASDAVPLLSSFISDADSHGNFYSADTLAPFIVSVFERFEYAESIPESERALFFKLVASELVLLLSVSKKETLVHDDGELGARVIKYLNEHIDKDLTLDKLAKRFFVSKYYLCRAFKKHNGISVHGYINRKRVMYAKQLIESGETAASAAYRVGFGDYSAFYRAYIKVIGRPPTWQDSERSHR